MNIFLATTTGQFIEYADRVTYKSSPFPQALIDNINTFSLICLAAIIILIICLLIVSAIYYVNKLKNHQPQYSGRFQKLNLEKIIKHLVYELEFVTLLTLSSSHMYSYMNEYNAHHSASDGIILTNIVLLLIPIILAIISSIFYYRKKPLVAKIILIVTLCISIAFLSISSIETSINPLW